MLVPRMNEGCESVYFIRATQSTAIECGPVEQCVDDDFAAVGDVDALR
jgi:hypothetical protein